MAIDFTLTKEQKDIQAMARSFAQEVLAPLAPKIDAEPDPFAGWQMAKPAYEEACKQGIAWSMLPKAYGGGGLSNVDFVIAAEEIQAVDPGFGTDGPRQRARADAGLVLRHRGTEAAVHRRRHRRHEQRVHRRLRGERAAPGRRAAPRTSTPPPSAARAWA